MATPPASNRTPAVEVVDRLKRIRPLPCALRVELADETTRQLAIPAKHRKWSDVVAMLDQLAWVAIEALNAKSEVVAIFQNDEPAADLEEIGDIPDKLQGQSAQLLRLMLHAQDVALKRNEAQTRMLTDTVLRFADVLMRRLVSLENSYASNLKLVEDFARAAGEQSPDESLMSTAALQAVLPHLMGKLLSPPPAGGKVATAAPPAGGGSTKP